MVEVVAEHFECHLPLLATSLETRAVLHGECS